MATFAVSVSFEVEADSYADARRIMTDLINHAVDTDLVLSGSEIDVELLDGEVEEE